MTGAGQSENTDVEALIDQLMTGDRSVLDELVPALYPQLRRMAHRQLRRESARPFQTTELVNEALLRWMKGRNNPAGQARLVAILARVMRNILVDEARARRSQKRGGEFNFITLTESRHGDSDNDAADVLDLDRAISELQGMDPRKAEVVELHYFGGLTVAEIADGLAISPVTVKRDLGTARAWIASQLS